jgi:hypothetical protein
MAVKAKCYNVRRKAMHALWQIKRGVLKCPRGLVDDLDAAVQYPCRTGSRAAISDIADCRKVPGQFSGAKHRRRRRSR